MKQQYFRNKPYLLSAASFMLTFLLFTNSAMAQITLSRTPEMKKDIPLSFGAGGGSVIFWIADERLDIGKGYQNSGTLNSNIYSEENCFDLTTRTGPLFKEVRKSEDTDQITERYFYLIKNKQGMIVAKYIDEDIVVEKEAVARSSINRIVIGVVLIAALVLVVLLVRFFKKRGG